MIERVFVGGIWRTPLWPSADVSKWVDTTLRWLSGIRVAYEFSTVVVRSEVNRAIGTPADLLLNDILVNAVVDATVILVVRVLCPRV